MISQLRQRAEVALAAFASDTALESDYLELLAVQDAVLEEWLWTDAANTAAACQAALERIHSELTVGHRVTIAQYSAASR